MSRVGWWVLGVIAFAVAAFLSMTSFGVSAVRIRNSIRAVEPRVVAAPSSGGEALIVPVAGIARGDLRDDWGDPREGGTRMHHGTDIPAPARTMVVAAAAGTVEKLFQSARGGTTLYVRSRDRRWTYYYAHLAGYAASIRAGLTVKAGDPLGYVGDTGDAGAGNFHLHFGLTRMRPEERWWQGEDVDPYPLLAAGHLPG
ncbi:M23 family metallopeptidase [uncultured Sphingomonas sp.]|uniref:M23 family metallopeptidase n=1 Tax=uncultured Sphingomonas sp. TaxID=158754 RepID=UPI0035CBC375